MSFRNSSAFDLQRLEEQESRYGEDAAVCHFSKHVFRIEPYKPAQIRAALWEACQQVIGKLTIADGKVSKSWMGQSEKGNYTFFFTVAEIHI